MTKTTILNLILLGSFTLPNLAFAAPAGTNQLRLETGSSKRKDETAFSYSVSWRKNDENIHRSNGLTFINGIDSKNPSSSSEVAHKITKAINAGVAIESPHDRGAVAKQTNNKNEIIVSNNNGFDLTHITIRDYTNQKLQYSIPNKSFKAASVNIAIDIVYSAAVEYVAGFSSDIKQQSAGGGIRVTIDQNPPIEIDTHRRSSEKIEKALALALGSKAIYSSHPIFPNFVQLRSKNYKDFDGGEVQLPALNAKSIIIEINDPGLGVLTKFKFPDTNEPANIVGKVPFIIAFVILAIFAYLFYASKKKSSV